MNNMKEGFSSRLTSDVAWFPEDANAVTALSHGKVSQMMYICRISKPHFEVEF